MERDGTLDELALTLSEAYYLARQGRVARGYMILLAGLDEAQESRVEDSERLVELWRRVLAQFQEQFPREWYRELGQSAALRTTGDEVSRQISGSEGGPARPLVPEK